MKDPVHETDTLVIGAGSAGLFSALRRAARGSVTVLEAGPDAGDPPPRWALYEYALPEAYYYRYTDLTAASHPAGPRPRRRLHGQLRGRAARPALVLRLLGGARLGLGRVPGRR